MTGGSISKMSLNSGTTVTEGLIDDLASQELNGRQIKNAARIAFAMASQEGEALEKRHFDIVLDTIGLHYETPGARVTPVEPSPHDSRPGKRSRAVL